MQEQEKIQKVRELTGASISMVKKYMQMFPKATVWDLYDIIAYDCMAKQRPMSVEEKFKHLK